MNALWFALIENIALITGFVVLVMHDHPWWALPLLIWLNVVKLKNKSSEGDKP